MNDNVFLPDQVVGVIYRSNPNLFGSTSGSLPTFFDFLVNMLGFVMPFPVCFHREVPVVLVALIGFVPPLLATVTAVAYGIWYLDALQHG